MPSEGSSSRSSNSTPSRDRIQVAAQDQTGDSKTYPMVDIHGNDSSSQDSQNSTSTDSTAGSRSTFERLPLFAQKAARRAQHAPATGLVAKAWRWLKGPEPPREFNLTDGLFPRIQQLPIRLLDAVAPGRRRKMLILLAYYILWMAVFIHVLRSSVTTTSSGKYGPPVTLSCIARLWENGQTCGINGDVCRPFENNTWVFRCPGSCTSAQVLNPYPVGDQEVIYQSLVVGGPTDDADRFAYRGDSFICGAAIHAGILNDGVGGLAVISLTGEKASYPSVSRNGISSIGFNSSFPMSFTFLDDPDTDVYMGQGSDPQWRLLAISVIFTAVLSLFTTSAPIFFASIFAGGFFQVALASNPPDGDLNARVSSALSRFLPAAFIMAVYYQISIRRTLKGVKAQVEKTVLWVGGFWVGALARYTTEQIPIQRLTPHDLQQQPGAIAALVVIVLIIFAAVVIQAWSFRIEGRLLKYLCLYIVLGICILLLLAVPDQNLRIHHYILAMLLLPGTALQTRPSLVFQGLLVGLFVDGSARWGFASILETSAALLGDASQGSLLPALMSTPNITSNNITFTWQMPPYPWDGVSVIVNDVERFRGWADDDVDSYTWERTRNESEYFRFGYMAYRKIQGISFGDYTKAGTWQADGNWVEMQPGPAK